MRESKSAATRITTKGQVVIPKAIRSHLGWAPGTPLEVTTRGEVVMLRTAEKKAASDWLQRVAGCVKRGDPIADLEAEHRDEVERDARRRT